MSIPSVCIVGRPNVGKSSLFNRLVGRRKAIVVEQSGTTRDRVDTVINLDKTSLKLVDTGGFSAADKGGISSQVKRHIAEAMEEAAVIVLVVDTKSGLLPEDSEVAAMLRKSSKPVILVANKTDNDAMENDAAEFYRLGFGDPVCVSCLHARGIGELRGRIAEAVSSFGETADEGHFVRIAIVGRPNVGKSSFVNCLLERERVIVSDIPGTTRDSIDTHFVFDGEDYILVDTAGIRHRRKIKTVVDTFSVMRSNESIKRADVVMLMIDAADGFTRDDIGILKTIEEHGKACIIAVNKWDLAKEVENVSREEYEKHLIYALERVKDYPMLFVSAKSGENVARSIETARVLNANLDLKVSTPFLNKLFEKRDPSVIPIPRARTRPNFLYYTQTGTRPIEFTAFVNNPSNVHQAHRRFIENILRENLPLKGIPVRIKMRRSRKERR